MIRLFLPQPWRKWGCPWKSGWACRLDRHGAAGSPAAPIWHQWYGQARGGEIRLLNDTDGRGVRVERGRLGEAVAELLMQQFQVVLYKRSSPWGVGKGLRGWLHLLFLRGLTISPGG